MSQQTKQYFCLIHTRIIYYVIIWHVIRWSNLSHFFVFFKFLHWATSAAMSNGPVVTQPEAGVLDRFFLCRNMSDWLYILVHNGESMVNNGILMVNTLIGGLEHEFYFPFHICDVILRIWLIFFRKFKPPTNQMFLLFCFAHVCSWCIFCTFVHESLVGEWWDAFLFTHTFAALRTNITFRQVPSILRRTYDTLYTKSCRKVWNLIHQYYTLW